MNRNIVAGLVAGLVAVTGLLAAAAPAEAGRGGHKFRHHGHHGHHGHHHGHRHFRHHGFKFHAPVHYAPVCVHHRWVYSYGHKKLVCLHWK